MPLVKPSCDGCKNAIPRDPTASRWNRVDREVIYAMPDPEPVSVMPTQAFVPTEIVKLEDHRRDLLAPDNPLVRPPPNIVDMQPPPPKTLSPARLLSREDHRVAEQEREHHAKKALEEHLNSCYRAQFVRLVIGLAIVGAFYYVHR
jgi:hypothetical protein